MTKWLSVLLGSISILIISHILIVIDFTVKGSNVFFTLTSLQILSSVGLTILLISPIFFPTILYGLPRFPEPKTILENQVTVPFPLTAEASKKPTRFESDYLLLIQQKTESCMQEFQPYLQPDCNLTQFSVLIQIPGHHLAYYFREVKKQSFIDFRNHWRVEHAKGLIREGKSSGMTLEAIGLLSGFSSRNTFLNAFKKIEGISPNDFVAQIDQ
jgi:AraC-like DNA-binding protein